MVDAYDKRAELYDLEFQDRSDLALLEKVTAGNVGRCLEIPCGSGRYIDFWRDSGWEVVFGDLSLAMLKALSQKLTRYDIWASPRQVDMRDISSLGRFDRIVVLREGFQLLNSEGRKEALKNFSKALERDGKILIDLVRLDLAGDSSDDNLPAYIRFQKEKLIDFEHALPEGNFKRLHRSILDARGNLSVEFFYEVTKGSRAESYTNSWTLYRCSPTELIEDGEKIGLKATSLFGYYDFRHHSPKSPRAIIIFEREYAHH